MRLNLITNRWLWAMRASGRREMVRISDLCAPGSADPLVSFAWGRPDLDIASLELVIGILTVALAPETARAQAAIGTFADPDALQPKLDALASAFVLDGPAPRFLQDVDELDGEFKSVDSLFIDATADFFGKPERFGPSPVLSRPAAAVSLYALQAFAPSGGRGHRTSLRGGGPMTTLVVPERGARPLWDLLAANVPRLHAEEVLPSDPARAAALFPWLGPTITSEAPGAPQISSEDPRVHPLQAFFGMPRRIVLEFQENKDRRVCSITGQVDEVVATGFRMRHGGVNYGAWLHPLTPYREDKKAEKLPLHPREGRLSYADWLGLGLTSVRNEGGIQPARAVRDTTTRLLVAGYAMDNAKVLDFKLESVPVFHAVDAERQDALERGARRMAEAATTASDAVRRAVAVALLPACRRSFAEKGLMGTKIAAGALALEGVRDSLFARTEAAFTERLACLAKTGSTLSSPPDSIDALALAECKDWARAVGDVGLRLFDEVAGIDALADADERDVVAVTGARRQLSLGFALYGRLGETFLKTYGLAPPEKTKVAGRKRKEKGAGA